MEFWFRGKLEFADRASIDAANEELQAEGYVGHEDNLLSACDLVWTGTVLTIQSRGSMPYSCFQISSNALRVFAEHASSGEVVALNVEDGLGERYPAGGEAKDIGDREVDALRNEYGWKTH